MDDNGVTDPPQIYGIRDDCDPAGKEKEAGLCIKMNFLFINASINLPGQRIKDHQERVNSGLENTHNEKAEKGPFKRFLLNIINNRRFNCPHNKQQQK